MSVFAELFLACVAWGAAWHFSAYPIEAAIKRPTWAYIAKLTTGVVTAYPFVEKFTVKAARLDEADTPTINRLHVWLFMGYFGAFVAYGIGKVVGTAIDPIAH
jgi:hypothetical protein